MHFFFAEQKASSSQWVTSSFGDFEDFGAFGTSTQTAKTKQSKLVTKPLSQCPQKFEGKKRPSYEDQLWSDKHSPRSAVMIIVILEVQCKDFH